MTDNRDATELNYDELRSASAVEVMGWQVGTGKRACYFRLRPDGTRDTDWWKAAVTWDPIAAIADTHAVAERMVVMGFEFHFTEHTGGQGVDCAFELIAEGLEEWRHGSYIGLAVSRAAVAAIRRARSEGLRI